jgi:precorrin-8X/cobalt-precorrin-8 methylmutase
MRVSAASTDPQIELDILRSRVDLSELPPVSRAVTEQIVAATADIGYAADLICLEDSLEAAVAALVGGAAVIADGAMTAVGIVGRPVICKFAEPLTERLARTAGISPPAAGVRLALAEAGPGAVWLVGSEPAAINEILTRGAEPALVIAMPAGFSAAVAAKRTLRDSGVPCLTNMSAKGGPVAAAAACAALLNLAAAVADPDRTRPVVSSRRAATS